MEPVLPFDLALRGVGRGGLTRALHRQLRAAVLERRLPGGFEMPSTRSLADALQVGRNTVIAAYDLLVAEGHAKSRPGARLVIVGPPASSRPTPVARSVSVDRERDARIAPHWRVRPVTFKHGRPLAERTFRTGAPESRYFDHDTWRRLVVRAMRARSRQSFDYGPALGIPELREAIARHVAFARAVVCTADDLIVTSGAQQAFDLLARLLVTPGRTQVAVENPGYPPLCGAFAAAGAQLVPVPVDDHGLRVERIPDTVKVICVTPSHQSPTGAAMSAARRAELLQRAREIGATVIEDDYDGEYLYDPQPQDALQTLDRDGRVFYVGTFSKSLFPALRKGFVVAPRWATEALGDIKDAVDSHSDVVTQAALASFIGEGHLARHIRRMRPIYAQRRRALVGAIEAQLEEWIAVLPGQAGLQVSVRVKNSSEMPRVLKAAMQHLPGALPLAACAIGKPPVQGLCIGYGCAEVAEIVRAARAMGRELGNRGH